MFLELTLGAAEREATLARLATMGLGERQRARVVAVEVLPAVIAAALAAWACALVLPRVVGPAIDLSVFTSSPVSVPLAPGVSFSATAPLVPDVASSCCRSRASSCSRVSGSGSRSGRGAGGASPRPSG